jgi:hypothetical protein
VSDENRVFLLDETGARPGQDSRAAARRVLDDLGLPNYLGWPYADKSGSLITFEADSLETAMRIIAPDPFSRRLRGHSAQECRLFMISSRVSSSAGPIPVVAIALDRRCPLPAHRIGHPTETPQMTVVSGTRTGLLPCCGSTRRLILAP